MLEIVSKTFLCMQRGVTWAPSENRREALTSDMVPAQQSLARFHCCNGLLEVLGFPHYRKKDAELDWNSRLDRPLEELFQAKRRDVHGRHVDWRRMVKVRISIS